MTFFLIDYQLNLGVAYILNGLSNCSPVWLSNCLFYYSLGKNMAFILPGTGDELSSLTGKGVV